MTHDTPEEPTMETTTKTSPVPCPECDGPVPIASGALESEIVPCPDCGAELEITALDPPALELAPEVEEDWGE